MANDRADQAFIPSIARSSPTSSKSNTNLMLWNQRWAHGRSFFRPVSEVIDTREYDVCPIPGDKVAKEFIEAHHYSGSYPAARFRVGLYRRGILSGVAVFSYPCNDAVLTSVFACDPLLSVELGRFVLLNEVPGNGESWFLARCTDLLRREGLVGLVSFSDPLPRQTLAGDLVFPGHIGTIYQAFNGVYLGRSTPRTLRLLPDGSVLNDRSLQKIRRSERGCQYARELLARFGAEPLRGDPVEWLQTWLPRITRSFRHPGNHKYAWPLVKTSCKYLPPSLPYPKLHPLFAPGLCQNISGSLQQ